MENDEKTPELEQDVNNNQEEESTEESQDETKEDNSEHQDEVDWKAEALKQKAINKRISEKLNKPETKVEVKTNTDNISPKDLYALNQANVHIDDFDDVVEYARFKKISIQEALKTDVIKTTLSTKSEYRKTAEATNTGPARKGSTKLSEDALLKNLEDGKIPEKGSEEAERLFWARRGGKR